MPGLTALPGGRQPGRASPSSGTLGSLLGGGKAPTKSLSRQRLRSWAGRWAGAGAAALMGQAEGNQEWGVWTYVECPGVLQGPCSRPAAVRVTSLPDQDGLTHPQVELAPQQSGAELGTSGFCCSLLAMGLSPHGQLLGASKGVRVAEEAVLIIYRRLWGLSPHGVGELCSESS